MRWRDAAGTSELSSRRKSGVGDGVEGDELTLRSIDLHQSFSSCKDLLNWVPMLRSRGSTEKRGCANVGSTMSSKFDDTVEEHELLSVAKYFPHRQR